MRFLAWFIFATPAAAFGAQTGYFHVDQPIPSPGCIGLVWQDCNKGRQDDSRTCQEIDNNLKALGPAKRTYTTQLKEPACQRVRVYTAAFLTCSDFLSAEAQIALRNSAAIEMGAHPEEIAEARKCIHAVNELNYSAQMSQNIKQLFADTETISPPALAGRSAPVGLAITPVSVKTATEN